MEAEGCISVEELAAFATCELSAARLRDVEKHLRGCASCRARLHAVSPTEIPAPPPPIEPSEPDGDEPRLPPGTSIGRFILGPVLGAGGMGVVYAARDPELQREVALKVLQRRAGGSMGVLEARMRREAQAMARLSHPNVLPVFDVGAYGGRLIVAMELVEGGTLREWLAGGTRSVAEILDVFAKAGSGLEAAHAAGLVHRDFKPDNVLVGKDGRVRVTDFGLARFAGAPTESDPGAPAPTSSGERLLGEALTLTGTVLGTPAYMAPEQLQGKPADARTDQFAFCVALYEALARKRPFPLGFGAVEDPSVPPATVERIPRWLRKPILRGLSASPSDRFPDMAPLLEAIRPRSPTLRRWLTVIALVVAAGAAGALGLHARARSLECHATENRARAAWSEADRRAVEDAFVATGRPYAEDTFRRTAAALDAYAAQWSSLAVASCEAPQEAASRDVLLKRAECLDLRLGSLQAFVGVLRRADAETLDRAVQAALTLPAVETCMGKDPLQGEGVPNDPATRDAARTVEQEVHEAEALEAAGHYSESVTAATRALTDADRVGFAPMRAHALLALALAQEGVGDLKTSEQTFGRASIAAEAAGAWAIAARALFCEGWRAADRGDYDRAEERLDHAAVWVERVGDDDELRANLDLYRGRELAERGKYDEARALVEKARALLEPKGGDLVQSALLELGIVADYQGRKAEARSYYQRALAWCDRVLGPDSSRGARVLQNLGMLEQDEGDFDAATRDYSRAVEILDRALGPDHPSTGRALTNLANIEQWTDHSAEALPLARRALVIVEKAMGPSADTAYALLSVSDPLVSLKQYDEAISVSERALAIFEREGRALGIADAKFSLGMALLGSGSDKARGRALLGEARATYVAEGKPGRLPEIDAALARAKP